MTQRVYHSVFAKRKMWVNLAGGFGAVLILMLLVAYVGYRGMANVIEKYNQGNHVNRMTNIILNARQQEKNFIIHRDKYYVEQLGDAVEELRAEVARAKVKFRNLQNTEHLDVILLETGRYKKAFDDYVKRVAALIHNEEEMNVKGQELIETAQSIEEKFDSELVKVRTERNTDIQDKLSKVEDVNLIIEWTLECQVNEKQYIVSKDEQNIENIGNLIQKIIELAKDLRSRFNEENNKLIADSLIGSAENYLAGFRQYVMLPWKGSELDMLEAARELIATSRSIRVMQHQELRQVQLNANKYMESHLTRAENMHEIVNSILLCLHDGRNFLISGFDRYIASVDLQVEEIYSLTERVGNQIEDVQSRRQVFSILDLLRNYKEAFDKSTELKKRHIEDIDVFMKTARKTNEAFEQIHANQILLIERQVQFARNVLFAGSALGLFLGAILALLVIKQTMRTSRLLSDAKERAESASQAKSDFLARMSHEIRTPLNAVTGLTSVVLKSELSTEQRDYLNKVQIAGNNLMEVINDILDFSKVEAGRLDLIYAPFNLDQVMEELADLFSNRLAQKDLELIFAVAPRVPRQLTGDAGRLTQVLTNLIENATKFTESGEVVITVDLDGPSSRASRKVLKFQVSDSGIGIDSKILPTLFEPFTQAEGYLSREYEGTGLGLTICSRLVKMMGGRIWAESTPGQGSTFSFTVVFEVEKQEKSRLKPPKELRGLKTLIVDDSAAARQVLRDLLESFTFKVSSVSSGDKAIEAIHQAAAVNEPYKLVLMDWKMPGMDGVETVEAIWNNLALSNPPVIIMVTAYGRELLHDRIDTAKFDNLLLKPVKPSQLFNTVMVLFGKQDAVVLYPVEEQPQQLLYQLAGRRVLIVEDSELNRDVVVALLEEAGMQVETAENGRVAVDMVAGVSQDYYDGVLMDIQMPIMDGYEATRHIRKVQPNLPVVALTAHALKGENERCLEAGMDDYLVKPIDEKQLERVLLQWVSMKNGKSNGDETSDRPNPESTPDDLGIIDVTGALARLGGRKQLYIRALGKFGSECSQVHETIASYLADGDMKSASRVAHTMKSTAATIGAESLNKIAIKLERAINEEGREAAGLLASFRGELELTLEAIDRYLETESDE